MKTPLIQISSLFFAACCLLVACGDDGDPGPQGAQGPQGEQGPQGDQGQSGTDGQDGADGDDAPNRAFYFQEGFKGYAGTADTYLLEANSSQNFGDGVSLNLPHEVQRGPDDQSYVLIGFDNFHDFILEELDDTSTEGCEEDYYVNEAILYLYARLSNSTFDVDNYSLSISFYDDDVFWTESAASWDSPNGETLWDAGENPEFSDFWQSVYGNYTVPIQVGWPGWVGIPIPRQVIKAWVCNPEANNRGMLIRLQNDAFAGNGQGLIQFASSESDQADFRPTLYINAEPAMASTSGKLAQQPWEQYLEDWKQQPLEEQLSPLNNK